MKNKTQLIVVGFAVVLIWSLVVYRFVDLKKQDTPLAQKAILKRIESGVNKQDKSYEYYLNYSEPFALNLKNTLEEEQRLNANKNKPIKKKVVPKKVTWPNIKFIGTMSSGKKGEINSYFLEINEKTETLTIQDSIGDIKILSLNVDSVWLEKEKEKKAFYID